MTLVITVLLGVGAISGFAFSVAHNRLVAFLAVILLAGIFVDLRAEVVAAGLMGWYELFAYQVDYVKEKQKHGKI
jgi:hypothetical protein